MEIKIKAYAYTIDIITEIRYFCKCNNAVFGKFRIIFTCTISKTDSFLHRSSHALFKISGNGKFVRTAVLPPHPSRNLRKSTPRPRTAPPHQPSQNRTIPCPAPSPLPFNERSVKCYTKTGHKRGCVFDFRGCSSLPKEEERLHETMC